MQVFIDVRLAQILKTVDLVDSEFMFDWLRNSRNSRFGRFFCCKTACRFWFSLHWWIFILSMVNLQPAVFFLRFFGWLENMFPTLRSPPFLEFGSFGITEITNQRHPKREASICSVRDGSLFLAKEGMEDTWEQGVEPKFCLLKAREDLK